MLIYAACHPVASRGPHRHHGRVQSMLTAHALPSVTRGGSRTAYACTIPRWHVSVSGCGRRDWFIGVLTRAGASLPRQEIDQRRASRQSP